MNLSLKQKKAVICGGSEGIGFACATEIALLGAECILVARNEASLKEAVSKLDKKNGQSHSYRMADFSKPETVKQMIDEEVASGPVHILINNTGGPPPGRAIDADTDDFLAAFNQHLICYQILVQAVVPGMKSDNYGRIINIISTSVKSPIKNLGVSNTIRGAVASWSKTLSGELGEFGITVNNILPGSTNTRRIESILKNNMEKKGISKEDAEKEMKKDIPMNRFAEPEEPGALAAFLASPAAAYITGVSIPVDGGRTNCL